MEVNRQKPNSFKWTRELTLNVITNINENYGQLTSGIKRNVFQKVTDVLNKNFNIQLSWDQIENKWKGLLRQYKKIKSHNETTGNNRKYWEYFDLIDEIVKESPEITAVATFCDTSEAIQTPSITDFEMVNTMETLTPAYTTNINERATSRRKRKVDFEESTIKYRNAKLKLLERYTIAIENISNHITKQPSTSNIDHPQ